MGIVYRLKKGSRLTYSEMDGNFSTLSSATGSLIESASAEGNTITFSKGDGTTFEVTTLASASAAESLVTASTNNNIITFTKGDDSTFEIAVDTGSAEAYTASFAVKSGSNQFSGDQFFTGSLLPEALSSGNGIWDLGSVTHPWRDLFLTTASLKFIKDAKVIAALNGEENGIRIGNIFIGTGSISVVSGSGDNLTVIGDVVNTTTSGSEIIPVPGDSLVIPAGSVSSSIQIHELGFITSSEVAEYLPTGSISSSIQLHGLGFITSSEVADYLPTGSVSSSAQLLELGFVSSSQITDYLPTGSISSSAQIISSLPTGSVSSSAQIISSLPEGSVSSSAQIISFLPVGTVSSSAQLDLKWTLKASGISHYIFNGPGLSGSANDPDIYLTRGETYRFENTMGAHPFRIQSTPNGSTGTPYNDGVTNNDVTNGTLIWEVQFDAPDSLYYQCTAHPDMGGRIYLSYPSNQLPGGILSGSQQITDLGFISSTSSGSVAFSGSTSFEGDTSFTGSTTMSGSLTVIDDQGFRVEGNTVLTGSNLFQGNTIIEGNSFKINTTSSFTGDVSITGSLTVTEGITGSLHGTSSVSLDSLLFDGKDSATFATTGSNVFKASQYISGSVIMAPSEDPGTSNINSTYLFTSASNFGNDECDFYYRNKGVLWDQEWIEQGVNSGLIYGGVVSFESSTLYISPGGGLVVNHNASTSSVNSAVPTQVKWGPITSSATYLTSSQFSHLYIDKNGDLQQQVENFTPEQYLEKIPLGTLGHLNQTTIDSFGEEKQTVYATHEQSNQFIRAFGPLKQQGYDLSASGSSLGFNVASGTSFKLGGFYSISPNNPSLCGTPALESTGKIVRVYQSSSEGGFIGDINAGNFYDVVDPTKYDDGSGTLVNISGSTTTIQRVFIGPTSERFYIYYGQSTYDSIPTALNNLTTEPFVESLTTSKSLTFIGYVVVQANATDISNTAEANLINAGLFRNTAGSSGGGTSTISNLGDITDVSITTPTTGEYLKYNSGVWENSNIQYSEVNNTPSGIISSSVQLESLGVSVSNGSTTEFNNIDIVNSGILRVDGRIEVSGSLSSPVIVSNPSFQLSGWIVIINASDGNFFTTRLVPGPQTINITGGRPGQTINIEIKQNTASVGNVSWDSNFKFVDGTAFTPTTTLGAVDILSAMTFDGIDWYVTGLKDFS